MATPYYGETSHPGCSDQTGHTCQELSGRTCVDCPEPAGTLWGPMWCPDDDARRLDKVSAGFAAIARELKSGR